MRVKERFVIFLGYHIALFLYPQHKNEIKEAYRQYKEVG